MVQRLSTKMQYVNPEAQPQQITVTLKIRQVLAKTWLIIGISRERVSTEHKNY